MIQQVISRTGAGGGAGRKCTVPASVEKLSGSGLITANGGEGGNGDMKGGGGGGGRISVNAQARAQ